MKKISIFIQLVFVMFMLSAIPAISVISVNSASMRKNAEEVIAETALNKIRANKELSDEMLTNIIYDALDLILAKQYDELNRVTAYETLNSDFQYVNAALKIKNSLSDLSNRNKMVHSIFYYMDNSDYLISSNGFIKMEGNDTMDWLDEAEAQIHGAEGTWYPRRLTEVKNGKEKTTELVSYLYRSSSLYTSAKVTIVFNVYEEEISKMIYSDFEEAGGEGFLINGNGDVIAHSNPRQLYSNISSTEYVSKILQSKKDDGYGITSNSDYLYTYKKSALYDWIYVNAYSLDQMYAQSKQITRTGIAMTLIILLIGAVCAVLFSLKISQPIRKLTDEVRGSNPAPVKSRLRSVNEIAYLSGAFGEIQEREKNLKDTLSEGEESMRRVAMSNLVHGESLQEKEKELLHAFFIYDHFIVCILAIDHFNRYQSQTTHEERKTHRVILYEKIRVSFPKEYKLDSIRYNVSSIAIIINFKNYDSDQVNSLIDLSLREVQNSYYKEIGYSLTVGISQVHNHFEGMKTCVDEANEALKKRLVVGSGMIVFYQKPKDADTGTYAGYLHEKRIINYLEIGDMDKIRDELNAVAEELKAMDHIAMDNIMMVFNQMIGSILMYLSGHNCSASAVFGGSQGNLYSMLTEMETIDEIEKFLESIFTKIIVYQKKDIQTEDRDYARMILQYIKLNYATDIDFESLSKEIGISYSYARKIVKESTGKSLIDNLNEIRIEEAKILLERTDLTVAEVSSAVGYHNVQSLYRLFKKFEGLSPKDYCLAISSSDEEDT